MTASNTWLNQQTFSGASKLMTTKIISDMKFFLSDFPPSSLSIWVPSSSGRDNRLNTNLLFSDLPEVWRYDMIWFSDCITFWIKIRDSSSNDEYNSLYTFQDAYYDSVISKDSSDCVSSLTQTGLQLRIIMSPLWYICTVMMVNSEADDSMSGLPSSHGGTISCPLICHVILQYFRLVFKHSFPIQLWLQRYTTLCTGT